MATRYAPPSPIKLPTYKPPNLELQRPPSPPAGQELFHGGIMAPMGCELAVHNIMPSENLSTDDVICQALHLIHEDNPDLTPVNPSFKLGNTPSFCSIKLRADITALDSNPRPDLLEPWIAHLRKYNPQWEVDWACAAPNKDKRLWISLKGVDGLTDKAAVDVARQELQKLGFRSVGGFALRSSGSIVVNMATLQVARDLRKKKSVKIGKLSKSPLEIDSFPVVQPEWAFELIITGLDHYDSSVKQTLDDYFSKNYMANGRTLWHCSRIVDEAYYCFVMTDWSATVQVLQDRENFEARCAQTVPNLGYPRLIYDVNTSSAFHDSIARKLKAAANTVSGNMTDLSTQIQNLRRDVDKGFQQVDARIDAQQRDLRLLSEGVSTLHDRVQSQSYALLAMQTSTMLQERKSAIEMGILHKSLTYNMLTDDQKAQARVNLAEMERQRDAADKELQEARAAARGLAVPSLPQPQNHDTASAAQSNPRSSPPSAPVRGQNNNEMQAVVGEQGARSSQRITTTRTSTAAKKRKVVNDSAVVSEEHNLNAMDLDNRHVPDSQGQVCPFPGSVKLPTDAALRQVTLISVDSSCTSGMSRHKYFPCGDRVVTCRRTNYVYTLAQSMFSALTSFTGCVILLIVLLSLVQECSAMNPLSSGMLSVYALNANGMVHEGKLTQISNAIKIRKPHVVVISETKTHDKVGKKLDTNDYNFFEETGIKMENHHLYKWGVVVGIRKDIQIAQRVEIMTTLKGRVVALDLVLGTNKGRGFLHRFIGAYAPWNPGTEVNETGFWNELAKISNAAAHSWSVAGDLNASVSNTERASGGNDARRHFLHFLNITKGIDLWSDLKPQRSRLHDWTCKAHNNRSSSGNIIDRVVISSNCAVDADIAVADKAYDFVQMTDHRAVISTLSMRSPESMNATPDIPVDLMEGLQTPRIKYPSKKDKIKFEEYRNRVDKEITDRKLGSDPITDDTLFLQRYTELTNVIVGTAKEVFGTTRKFDSVNRKISSPLIRRLETRLKYIGGALNLERRGAMAFVSEGSREELVQLRQDYQQTPQNSDTDLRKYISKKRREVYKELYHARMQEIISRARQRDRRRIAFALQGGSTRKMINAGEYVGLPTAVNRPRNPGEIVTDPEGVKEATCDYLTDLYNRHQPPIMQKPWMTTPSVIEVKERVAQTPFQWPQKATLTDFQALLRRGNQRPAPGPDGWEKWCVKNLSDSALQLVLDLHNYEVLNARFPGSVKDMICTMFHKRNLRTDLSNWRGIMMSNFLANTPMAWLTNLLTTYSSRLCIVPGTQVATQQGVQTRDVISYLSGIKCFAQRNRQTVYALQRDQMKGFDYLAPQGFYDALEAYGLPSSIADLDRAAQSNTNVLVRTAFGTAGPIVINAVTKQGGPASPLKSVLTTSLGHRYLDDISAKDDGLLSLETETSLKKRQAHHPDHKLRIPITMVEATDDSIIFATNLPTLQRLTLAMERFQYAYGWLTSWKKTVAYGLCIPEGQHSSTVQMPSITVQTGGQYDPETVTWHEVPLKLDELQFLRTRVDDPSGRFEELHDFIKNFRFPKFSIQTPITLARKIVMQNIISRCRALLSLQPVKHMEAEILDKAIATKIHDLLRFPYSPQPRILTLPLHHHGLDFPSITRINAGIALEGLMRDLNHHVEAYRNVARITHADWMCRFNGCGQVIDGIGLNKDFSHRYGQIPATWLIAHKVMCTLSPKLSLRQTDASYIMSGEVSIAHIANISKSHGLETLDGTNINCLARKGITTLQDIGQWRRNGIGKWVFVIATSPDRGRWTEATRKSWERLERLLMALDVGWLFEGGEELLLARSQRRREAENQIRVLTDILDIHPSPNAADDIAWASDGSMVPASAGILDDKTVTAALTGHRTMVMRLQGRNSNILHGEIFGIIMGHLLIPQGGANDDKHLYTDHLNTTRFLQDSRSNINQDAALRYRNGRSYLRWLKLLSEESSLRVVYTKGHSNSDTHASRLNADADHYATIAQSYRHHIPIAPAPTFTMNDFTFYTKKDGWIESNVRIYADQLLSLMTVDVLAKTHHKRMSTWLYHQPGPPTYIYHKATSAYTAAVQLYARSGQLATAEKVEERQGDGNGGKCRMGCLETEDEHHIFVKCPIFEEWRQEAGSQLQKTLADRLKQTELSENDVAGILNKAKSFFMDDSDIWPLSESCYFLGLVPNVRHWITQESERVHGVTRERIIKGIYCDWHNSGVRLASRIYGEMQRRVTRVWERNKLNRG